MLDLIKQQTSVVNSTLNIVKNNQDELFKQVFENSQHSLNQLTLAMIQWESILAKYEKQQDDIIDAVTHTNGKNIAMHILTPKQWKEQENLIKETIATALIPSDNFYGVINIKAFRLGKILAFKLSIPLINNDKFSTFRIIPIPFR